MSSMQEIAANEKPQIADAVFVILTKRTSGVVANARCAFMNGVDVVDQRVFTFWNVTTIVAPEGSTEAMRKSISRKFPGSIAFESLHLYLPSVSFKATFFDTFVDNLGQKLMVDGVFERTAICRERNIKYGYHVYADCTLSQASIEEEICRTVEEMCRDEPKRSVLAELEMADAEPTESRLFTKYAVKKEVAEAHPAESRFFAKRSADQRDAQEAQSAQEEQIVPKRPSSPRKLPKTDRELLRAISRQVDMAAMYQRQLTFLTLRNTQEKRDAYGAQFIEKRDGMRDVEGSFRIAVLKNNLRKLQKA